MNSTPFKIRVINVNYFIMDEKYLCVFVFITHGCGNWNISPNTWYSIHLFMYLGIHHTLPKKKDENITPVTTPSPLPWTLFSNSAYSWFWKSITFWKIYILFNCRQTRFSVPPFKSLYQSYKFHSLKMGYLVDPQGDPKEFCVPLSTKHTSWEMAHLTSTFLPKKGGDIFSTSQGASGSHSKPG